MNRNISALMKMFTNRPKLLIQVDSECKLLKHERKIGNGSMKLMQEEKTADQREIEASNSEINGVKLSECRSTSNLENWNLKENQHQGNVYGERGEKVEEEKEYKSRKVKKGFWTICKETEITEQKERTRGKLMLKKH